MTAPDGQARLHAVAGWDVPAVRAGLHALADLDDALPSWRSRLDAAARALADDAAWTGPAAAPAQELLLRLSGAAAALDAGFADSRAACGRLLRATITASDHASTALALAAQLPVPLDDALADAATLAASVDRLVLGPEVTAPAVAAARTALAAAEAAEAAAARALDALPSAGPPGLAGLLDAAAAADLPLEVPRDGRPRGIAGWWAALPAGAQLAVVGSAPGAVGSLDGVPAWARDRANRALLAQAIEDPRGDDGLRETARVVAALLAAEEAAGRPAQLHLLDLAGDRVAVAFGDLDSAAAVAVVVPGIHTSPRDDLGAVAARARDLAAAARGAEPGLAVAAVAWLGYRTPHTPRSVLTRSAAARGGAALDDALDGLVAARGEAGAPRSRTTVVGHSYGTVVIDEAADRPGRLAADAVVLLGSPGMEGDADALEAAEVHDAAAPADPVSWAGWFGTETWADRFGSAGLPVDPGTGHSGYFDPHRPTLGAMGEVVAGRRPG
ncbi:alpha/beta hydrolase [Blastococcus sp. SYSU D01042]